jgi:hypothetical protein
VDAEATRSQPYKRPVAVNQTQCCTSPGEWNSAKAKAAMMMASALPVVCTSSGTSNHEKRTLREPGRRRPPAAVRQLQRVIRADCSYEGKVRLRTRTRLPGNKEKHAVERCGHDPAQWHYYGSVIAPSENHVQSTAQERDHSELKSRPGVADRSVWQYPNTDKQANGWPKQGSENKVSKCRRFESGIVPLSASAIRSSAYSSLRCSNSGTTRNEVAGWLAGSPAASIS